MDRNKTTEVPTPNLKALPIIGTYPSIAKPVAKTAIQNQEFPATP